DQSGQIDRARAREARRLAHGSILSDRPSPGGRRVTSRKRARPPRVAATATVPPGRTVPSGAGVQVHAWLGGRYASTRRPPGTSSSAMVRSTTCEPGSTTTSVSSNTRRPADTVVCAGRVDTAAAAAGATSIDTDLLGPRAGARRAWVVRPGRFDTAAATAGATSIDTDLLVPRFSRRSTRWARSWSNIRCAILAVPSITGPIIPGP